MRKLLSILLLSSIWLSSFGQTVPADRIITLPVPSTGVNKGKQSDRYSNITAYNRFYPPRFASNVAFLAAGGKDSTSVYFNSTIGKLIISKQGGSFDTVATSASPSYYVQLSPATQQIGGIDVSSYIKSGTNVFVDDAVGNTSTLSTTSLTLSTTTGGGNITTGGVNFGGFNGSFSLTPTQVSSNSADGTFNFNANSTGLTWTNNSTGDYFNLNGLSIQGIKASNSNYSLSTTSLTMDDFDNNKNINLSGDELIGLSGIGGLNQYILNNQYLRLKRNSVIRELGFSSDTAGTGYVINQFPDRPGQLATKGDIADSIVTAKIKLSTPPTTDPTPTSLLTYGTGGEVMKTATSAINSSTVTNGVYTVGDQSLAGIKNFTNRLDIGAGAGTGYFSADRSAYLDIANGDTTGLVVGADNMNDTRTANATKVFRIGVVPYNNADKVSTFLFASNGATDNAVNIGGGTLAQNSSTLIRFYTAANKTTVQGTERMSIGPTGGVNVFYGQSITTGADATTGLSITGFSPTQSADMILARSSVGTNLFRVIPTGGLDVSDGMITQVLGADVGLSTRTLNTNKAVRIGAYTYANTSTPFGLINANSTSMVNQLNFGGGTGAMYGATDINFYTAANTTTTAGTRRGGFNTSGVFDLQNVTPYRALVSDVYKGVVSSATTAIEIGYVNGVTSPIQTQLDGKASTAYADAKVANDLTASTTVAPSKTAVNNALALKQDITAANIKPVSVKNANYTLTSSDYTVIAGTGLITFTLPSASSSTGRVFVISNKTASSITIDTTAGANEIKWNSATYTTPVNTITGTIDGWMMQSDGTYWYKITGN